MLAELLSDLPDLLKTSLFKIGVVGLALGLAQDGGMDSNAHSVLPSSSDLVSSFSSRRNIAACNISTIRHTTIRYPKGAHNAHGTLHCVCIAAQCMARDILTLMVTLTLLSWGTTGSFSCLKHAL